MEYEEKLSFDVTFGLCLNCIQICELILSLDTHSWHMAQLDANMQLTMMLSCRNRRYLLCACSYDFYLSFPVPLYDS